MEDLVPLTRKELLTRKTKQRNLCLAAIVVLVVIGIIVFHAIDVSLPEPGIELPMIKEFKEIPFGMTLKEYVSMTGWMIKGSGN